MEINTEINRVFGTEMAKLFASNISEEEMQKTAQEIWENLNRNTDSWGRRQSSELEDYIKKVLLENLHNKILEILKEPENDAELEKRARAMIAKAQKVAEEAIVKDIARNMCERTLSVWNSHDKFVDDVLGVLHAERQSGRL